MGIFDEDDEYGGRRNPFGRVINTAQLMQIVEMAEGLKAEVQTLTHQNEKLKASLAKSNDDLRFVKSDRETILVEFNKLKDRFSGQDLEGKYVKCLTAMYAISNSISEESSKKIVDDLLKELGEKK